MKRSNPWLACRHLPQPASAVLAALHLREPDDHALHTLNQREWREALDYCDRSQLTLPLADTAAHALPDWVRRRVEEDSRKNCVRVRGIEELYRVLTARLGQAGIEFLALKGLAHCELFGTLAARRVQYDIDLYVPPEVVKRAAEALLPLGFEPIPGMEDSPTDHLPALIRKTGWQWRGDFFDPEIPVAVELHFQFWNEAFEVLPAPGIEEFWERRVDAVVGGATLKVLRAQDAVGYAALHLLRHILRGSVRPFHVYELARFLEFHAADDAFWRDWVSLHDPALRQLEAIACRLAEAWFGCRLAPEIAAGIAAFPGGVRRWFEGFALSPATGVFRSNKDELWLHVSLLRSAADAWRVARQRLLPMQLPGPVYAVHVPDGGLTAGVLLKKHARYAAFLASRLRHHVAVLPRVAASGMRWRWGAAARP